MYSTLIPLYGPFAIHSFGVCIVLGVSLFTYLCLRHPGRAQLISADAFINGVSIGILAAIIGGRMLYLIGNGTIKNILYIWEGGFSLLGSLIAVLCCVSLYLKKIGTPLIPLFDIAAIYAPLLQSISRIGCFFAGCCYGKATTVFWAVPLMDACHPTLVHPTQLYSAAALFCLFLVMQYMSKKQLSNGSYIALYLAGMSMERFFLDFWRADQEYCSLSTFFSLHQLIALAIFIFSLALFAYVRRLTIHQSSRATS